jgi:hypothetical protein
VFQRCRERNIDDGVIGMGDEDARDGTATSDLKGSGMFEGPLH